MDQLRPLTTEVNRDLQQDNSSPVKVRNVRKESTAIMT